VVHCRGGIGRSGLVAASVVTTYGFAPTDAIARVRQAQPLAVETRLQEAYVGRYAERGAG
jgi:ADP-ribosyl-[dinitrogen reductase] hydrolase